MTTAVNTQLIVGDETMRRVFRPARLTHLADIQPFLDAVEIALVNLSADEGGKNAEAASDLKMAENAILSAGFRCGTVHEGVEMMASEFVDLQAKLDESASWPEWATKCLKIIRDFSGADGYDDATEGVDLPGELEEALEHAQAEYQEHVAAFPKREAELINRIEKLQSELDTANALVHCVCGSRADQHGIGDGHSPVSAYHHALSNAEKRIVDLEGENKALADGFAVPKEDYDELKHRMDGLGK